MSGSDIWIAVVVVTVYIIAMLLQHQINGHDKRIKSMENKLDFEIRQMILEESEDR